MRSAPFSTAAAIASSARFFCAAVAVASARDARRAASSSGVASAVEVSGARVSVMATESNASRNSSCG